MKNYKIISLLRHHLVLWELSCIFFNGFETSILFYVFRCLYWMFSENNNLRGQLLYRTQFANFKEESARNGKKIKTLFNFEMYQNKLYFPFRFGIIKLSKSLQPIYTRTYLFTFLKISSSVCLWRRSFSFFATWGKEIIFDMIFLAILSFILIEF
jgi:hypothetical protein